MQPLSASIESIETMDESMEEMNHKVGRKHKRDAAGGKANKRKRGGRRRHRGGKSGRQKIKATPIPTLYPTEFPTSTGKLSNSAHRVKVLYSVHLHFLLVTILQETQSLPTYQPITQLRTHQRAIRIRSTVMEARVTKHQC
jgi:hypothetical protein